MERRQEEEELLRSEFKWTADFFNYKARIWEQLAIRSTMKGSRGEACYASRQQATFARLRDQCHAEWDKVSPALGEWTRGHTNCI